MCDRTQEFLSLIHTKTTSSSGAKSPSQRPFNGSAAEALKGKNAFHDAAGEIARGVHKTSSLLAKLTALVRRQGLFEDPTDEINTLVFRIKQDIDELNAKCDAAAAQSLSETHKTSSFFLTESPPSQLAQHNVKVVSHLKSDLLTATKDFKNVLELRSSKMKDQQLRRVELAGRGALSAVNSLQITAKSAPYASSSSSAAAAALRGQSAMASNSGRGGNDNGNGSGSDSVAVRRKPLPSPYTPYTTPYTASAVDQEEQRQMQPLQQMQLQQERQPLLLLDPVAATTQYFDAREQAVTEVERTIGELGSLFKRLATMLHEQQELVERIDEDVENAVANTESAKSELVKALESAKSNRGMFMKIGGILLIFVLFFILFLM